MSWLEGLTAQLTSDYEQPTGDWKTAEQLAAEMGRCAQTARRMVRQLISQQLVKMKSFQIKQQSGRTYPVPHYSPV